MSWARVGVALLLLCIGFVAGARFDRAQWDEAKLAQRGVVVKTQANVIATNQAKDTKAEKVDSHVQEQIKIVAGAAARAAAERDGLRDALAAVRADALSEAPTRARLVAQTSAAADSLGECSTSYTALARERDELAIQVDGLLALTEPTSAHAETSQPQSPLDSGHP